jgi:hypothetical protein
MFHFIVGLSLVGLIIMLMISSPAFRNFVLIAVVVLGGGLWLLIDSSNKSAEKSRIEKENQERFALAAIKISDLKLDDVKLKKASYGLSDYTLEGTVTNNSSYPLGTIWFEVTLTDCQNDNCRIVGQTNASTSVTVPAGQVRAFSSYALRFNNLPPVSGARSWTFKVTGLHTA